MRGPAFFAYANNYLIDVKFGVIVDVEASRAIRQAEVGAAKTMIDRTEERFGLKAERLAADTAYGSGANLNWLVQDKKIAPHIPVIDKSRREDGTFSRGDFTSTNSATCTRVPLARPSRRPAGWSTMGRHFSSGQVLNAFPITARSLDCRRTPRRHGMASMRDCRSCLLKAQCCPKAPFRRASVLASARATSRASS